MAKNKNKMKFLTIGLNDELDRETKSNEDSFTKQQQQLKVINLFIRPRNEVCIQEEAKYAFALGAKMARMQVETERQTLGKRKSSLYDLVYISKQNLIIYLYLYFKDWN